MRIIITIDAERIGPRLPEYEDQVIDKLELPGMLFFGDSDGDDEDASCGVLVNTVEWKVEA